MKPFARILLFIICLMACMPVLAEDGLPAAHEVPIRVLCGRRTISPALTDGDIGTCANFNKYARLTIQSDEPFSALYILWHDAPEDYTLIENDIKTAHGTEGFCHEYIQLSEAACEVTLFLDGADIYTIDDIYAYSAGYLPDSVQVWQPPLEKADVLVIPTHSDDEFVFFGGVIPMFIEADMSVQVAYITTPKARRMHECLDSLWEAGIRNYPVVSGRADKYCLTYEDAVLFYGRDFMTDYLTECIRSFKPLIVINHDEHGDSGHNVHKFGTQCLLKAVAVSSDPEKYPDTAAEYGTWDVPKLYLHACELDDECTVVDFETPLERYGGRTAFEVAEDSFAKCVSQVKKNKYRVYEAGHKNDVHRWVLKYSLVGEDIFRNSMLENLDVESFRALR